MDYRYEAGLGKSQNRRRISPAGTSAQRLHLRDVADSENSTEWTVQINSLKSVSFRIFISCLSRSFRSINLPPIKTGSPAPFLKVFTIFISFAIAFSYFFFTASVNSQPLCSHSRQKDMIIQILFSWFFLITPALQYGDSFVLFNKMELL